jgi:hypothetical protein
VEAAVRFDQRVEQNLGASLILVGRKSRRLCIVRSIRFACPGAGFEPSSYVVNAGTWLKPGACAYDTEGHSDLKRRGHLRKLRRALVLRLGIRESVAAT